MLVALASMGLGSTCSWAADADQTEQDKLFKEGMYQREQGNLYTAIEAFQTVLSNQPSLNRVRLELAVAYYRTLNFAEAKAQAQTVLNDPKTPENVRLGVLAFLAQLKKDEEAFLAQRNVWQPSISAGLLYDSNVNAGPTSGVIDTAIGPLTLTDASRSVSDWATVLQAGLSHRYQSPDPIKIGEKAARFVWQSQLNFYTRNYFSKDDFNLDVLSAATGPAWLVANNWRANINAQADYI
jgi:tetratricopeptide (TPR) repeat protein